MSNPAITWLDAFIEAEGVKGGVLAHYERRLGVRIDLSASDAVAGSRLFERGLRLRELEKMAKPGSPLAWEMRENADLIFGALRAKAWSRAEYVPGSFFRETK